MADKPMKWDDTVAASCRWAEYAKMALNIDGLEEHEVLWDISENDYQGSADVLIRSRPVEYSWMTEDAQYKMIEWSYGSCSGCDGWEDEPHHKVLKDFAEMVIVFQNKNELRAYVEGLERENKPGEYGYTNVKIKIDAIRKELAREEG